MKEVDDENDESKDNDVGSNENLVNNHLVSEKYFLETEAKEDLESQGIGTCK